ncbi:hypothetical protein CW703_00075 [Candidatus Bathyarchaeota archaeon]|nr:MAG: hypothetical protein CW703_00075 [Candidatus Bathyarchaeota archaeon]
MLIFIGFIGLGGAPSHNVKDNEPVEYLWDENVPVIRENLLSDLKISLEKIMLEHPNYVILVSHSKIKNG